MTQNQQPGDYDAVLGGMALSPVDGVVLGGIEGLRHRASSTDVKQRIGALSQALNYGDAGLDLAIAALQDTNEEVRKAAYLLLQQTTEPKVRQALLNYTHKDMIAWWRLNETEGSTVTDSVGTSHGTMYGTTPIIHPQLSSALSFDGVDDYVEIPHSSALNVGTGDFSIFAWVKSNSQSLIVMLDKRVETSGPVQGWVLSLYEGKMLFQLANGDGHQNYGCHTFVGDNQWHHVGVVIHRNLPDGGRWCIDGVKSNGGFNPTNQQGCLDNSKPLRIGRRSDHPSWGGFFNGCICDVRLFNRALDATEVEAIYRASIG